MEDIRNSLLRGEKLTKKQYKFAVELEKKRLLTQLLFLTIVSAIIAFILFVSLYFDIKGSIGSTEDTSNVAEIDEAVVVTPDVVDDTTSPIDDTTVDDLVDDTTGDDTVDDTVVDPISDDAIIA